MGTSATAPAAAPSAQTLRPFVVAYCYAYRAPINITPWLDDVQVSTSLAGSTRDTASLSCVGHDVAQLLMVGDWVQIDLRDRENGREHLFFGRITALDPSMGLLGSGGGAEISTTVTVTTWASVFEIFAKDVRTFFQVRARDLVADPGDADLPLLLKIVEAFGPEGFFAPPHVHVQMLMQVMARYGGTLRQTFDLPASFSPGGNAISLIDIVCKMSRPRLGATRARLLPVQAGTGGDGNYVVDAPTVNVALRADAATGHARTWAGSAWLLCDWATTFAAHPYYPQANGVLDEVLQLTSSAPLWSGACEYADLPWCQLHCALVEHVDWLGSAVHLTAHDGTEFRRDFLCSISFQPIPHPVYRAGTTPFRTEQGDAVVPADSTGYQRRPKVVLDTRYCSSLPMGRTMDEVRTSWQVTPQDAAFRAMATYDAAWLGYVSAGRLPVFDVESIAVYGYKPLEVQTRYWLDAAGKEFWRILAHKTAMQYAWTVQQPGLLAGAVSFPAFVANVPRPADVVLLVDEVAGAGGIVGTDRAPGIRPGPLDAATHGKPGHHGGALSVYAEAVAVRLACEEGVWSGTVQVSYSHGVPVLLGGRANLRDRPYYRGMAWSDCGIDPKYFLPASPVVDLLDAVAAPVSDDGLPARIDKAVEAIRPATRVRAPVRHRPRPVPAAPIATGPDAMSTEAPTEIGMTEADLVVETGPRPPRRNPKPVPLPASPAPVVDLDKFDRYGWH